MRLSVASSIREYVTDLIQRMRSLGETMIAALPYVFGASDSRREITEQYPDPISSKTIDDLPPRSRGMLFNRIEKCTGCGECEKVCPTRCINVKAEPGRTENMLWVSVFDIDVSKCIFCGLCTDVCMPQSLTHTKAYEASVKSPKELLLSFGLGPVTDEQRARWTLPSTEEDFS